MLLFFQQVAVITPLSNRRGVGGEAGWAGGEAGGASLLHTARHTQRCSNGSEHRDNHIKDCFPLFVFHTF